MKNNRCKVAKTDLFMYIFFLSKISEIGWILIYIVGPVTNKTVNQLCKTYHLMLIFLKIAKYIILARI